LACVDKKASATKADKGETKMENSVSSHWLSGMSDDEIRSKCAEVADKIVDRVFPGKTVHADSLAEALAEAKAAFTVEKHPVLLVHSTAGAESDTPATTAMKSDPEVRCGEFPRHVATVRTDTMAPLGMVGKDYSVVQTADAMKAVAILAERGDVEIRNVELIDGGGRVRVTALLGTTEFPSLSGEPNTLGHFGVFEATHNMSAAASSSVYTLRLECFNGMTSKSLVKTHKLRHTSRAGERVDAFAQETLRDLLGDVEAEKAFFLSLVNRPMSLGDFEDFVTDLLVDGKVPDAEKEKSRRTRFENNKRELIEYFVGGNQGAGPTAWGGYNSVTRWIEGKREGIEDAAKAAAKFDSNSNGEENKKIQKAVELLRLRSGEVVPKPRRRDTL
jgi:hypothetical protein